MISFSHDFSSIMQKKLINVIREMWNRVCSSVMGSMTDRQRTAFIFLTILYVCCVPTFSFQKKKTFPSFAIAEVKFNSRPAIESNQTEILTTEQVSEQSKAVSVHFEWVLLFSRPYAIFCSNSINKAPNESKENWQLEELWLFTTNAAAISMATENLSINFCFRRFICSFPALLLISSEQRAKRSLEY